MFFYSIFSRLVYFILPVVSLFSSRVRQLQKGRKNQQIHPFQNGYTIWFHCASYGEYEGIAPLLNRFHSRKDRNTILSFFSPSGYNHTIDKDIADIICYSPWDTSAKVNAFLDLLTPDALVVSQNDYWPNMIFECTTRQIPVYFIGTYICKSHWWTSSILRSMTKPLRQVSTIHLQDKQSFMLLQNAGYKNINLAGNPRIQQVIDNKRSKKAFPGIKAFIDGSPCIIMGSTLKSDHEVISKAIPSLSGYKIIIAPHEIIESHIQATLDYFTSSIRLSAIQDAEQLGHQVLIVDSIGDLKYLYKYADIAYVGGGFGKGTHSTLEPAIFKIPVISGPNINKFIDTTHLHKIGLVRLVNDHIELLHEISEAKSGLTEETSSAVELYMQENSFDINKMIQKIETRITL